MFPFVVAMEESVRTLAAIEEKKGVKENGKRDIKREREKRKKNKRKIETCLYNNNNKNSSVLFNSHTHTQTHRSRRYIAYCLSLSRVLRTEQNHRQTRIMTLMWKISVETMIPRWGCLKCLCLLHDEERERKKDFFCL